MENKDKIKKLLINKGCCLWSRETQLMLIPHKYYNKIPEGIELVDIFDKRFYFKKGKTDNDQRAGMLAYGMLPPDYEKLLEVLS